MPATAKPTIRRRGFRNAPVAVRDRAEAKVQTLVAEDGADHVLAALRPMSYCGPGSAGERGAYLLELHWRSGWSGGTCFRLDTIEAS